MTVEMKKEMKFERLKQQFGCGYYSVCCRNHCPCNLKDKEYDPSMMNELKQEFDQEAMELFG